MSQSQRREIIDKPNIFLCFLIFADNEGSTVRRIVINHNDFPRMKLFIYRFN